MIVKKTESEQPEFKPFDIRLTFTTMDEVEVWRNYMYDPTDEELPGSGAVYNILTDILKLGGRV